MEKKHRIKKPSSSILIGSFRLFFLLCDTLRLQRPEINSEYSSSEDEGGFFRIYPS